MDSVLLARKAIIVYVPHWPVSAAPPLLPPLLPPPPLQTTAYSPLFLPSCRLHHVLSPSSYPSLPSLSSSILVSTPCRRFYRLLTPPIYYRSIPHHSTYVRTAHTYRLRYSGLLLLLLPLLLLPLPRSPSIPPPFPIVALIYFDPSQL